MPRRTLIEHRPFLLGAIVLALAWYLLRDSELGGIWLMLLKGGSVAALACYAFVRHSGIDARWLAIGLVVFAMSTMAAGFWPYPALLLGFFGALIYLSLFLRNPRIRPSGSQKGAGVALLAITPLLFWMVAGGTLQAAIYGLTVGAMAAAGWMSRFPRYRVGSGAVLLALSNLLTMAVGGGFAMAPDAMINMLSWPLFFIGQFLICTGVIQLLKREHRA